eukprot:scaffold246402_cov28-Tisochrysis_lutea.AAC.2
MVFCRGDKQKCACHTQVLARLKSLENCGSTPVISTSHTCSLEQRGACSTGNGGDAKEAQSPRMLWLANGPCLQPVQP